MEHYALPVQVYGVGLVFARVGALMMLLPGVGEQVVPARVRLALAFILSLTIYPIVRTSFPAAPNSVGELAGQLGIETAIGLGIGALLRTFLGALTVAGETVSIQTTLSFAQTANPLQAQPTPSLGAFLILLGAVLVFSTDLHQLFIGAIVHSFTLFQVGKPIPLGDFATLSVKTVGQMFALGVQLAAPVIVFSLIFNVAAGLIGRVMPQFQIFFVATPLSVLLGLSVFAISLGVLGLVWVDRFRDFASQFV